MKGSPLKGPLRALRELLVGKCVGGEATERKRACAHTREIVKERGEREIDRERERKVEAKADGEAMGDREGDSEGGRERERGGGRETDGGGWGWGWQREGTK